MCLAVLLIGVVVSRKNRYFYFKIFYALSMFFIIDQEQAVKNVSLTQPYNFKSACGCPEFTNYTVGFSACLDYIFYQTDKLKVSQVVPFPTTDELKAHMAIPSIVFPSDHIALIADLEWK